MEGMGGGLCIRIWLENLKETYRLEGTVVHGRIILKWIIKIKMGGCGLDSSGFGHEQIAFSFEHSELSGCTKRRELLTS